MNIVLPVFKTIGLTPKQALDHFRRQFPEYEQEKLSYAGRLDPMAEGVLLILAGEANQDREKYLGLDKEYEFEVIFGLSTDTYDGLGLVDVDTMQVTSRDLSDEVAGVLKTFTGIIEQSYPPYSSKTYQGKPLWWWARQGMADELVLPVHKVVIDSIQLTNVEKVHFDSMVDTIIDRVQSVIGDYRQDSIVKRWYQTIESNSNVNTYVYSFHTLCSSGTYIRQLAYDMGELLNYGAIVYSIKRTSVGDYSIGKALALDAA